MVWHLSLSFLWFFFCSVSSFRLTWKNSAENNRELAKKRMKAAGDGGLSMHDRTCHNECNRNEDLVIFQEFNTEFETEKSFWSRYIKTENCVFQ